MNGVYLVTSKVNQKVYIVRYETIKGIENISNSFDLSEFSKNNGCVRQASTKILRSIVTESEKFEFIPLICDSELQNLKNNVIYRINNITDEEKTKYKFNYMRCRDLLTLAGSIMKDKDFSYDQAVEYIRIHKLCE